MAAFHGLMKSTNSKAAIAAIFALLLFGLAGCAGTSSGTSD
jgi:hypothetical protein